MKVKEAKVSANALTKHALYVLRLKGVFAWRQNNGGVYDPTKKVFRANSSTPGISDILGVTKDGRIVAVEIKSGKDKLSEAQMNFLKEIRDRGGIAFVVRIMNDIEILSNKF